MYFQVSLPSGQGRQTGSSWPWLSWLQHTALWPDRPSYWAPSPSPQSRSPWEAAVPWAQTPQLSGLLLSPRSHPRTRSALALQCPNCSSSEMTSYNQPPSSHMLVPLPSWWWPVHSHCALSSTSSPTCSRSTSWTSSRGLFYVWRSITVKICPGLSFYEQTRDK